MNSGLEESKSDRAYRELRHRLIMLDIQPGAAINEASLTGGGLGRTPIREALKRLESDHLVVSYPRRGTFAANVDITDLAEIYEVRQLLEPLGARKAAEGISAQLRSEFEDLVTELRQASTEQDKRRLLELDLEAHRLIYRALDNRHLAETLERLDDLATRIWCLVQTRLPDFGDSIGEHINLLRAIMDGDADRAAELAADHVRHFEAVIRGAL
ncbi:GntR family transcriptional regulator [Microbacterium sp.]|uniref:GntR family transcriptional regulator n=1 Tax=Microbacterium sp. TaxID=51671 RepID=UPI0039E4C619